MQFTTIRYDGESVGLKWEENIGDAIDKHDWSCDEPPTPAFKASLAAFSSFVVGLIEAPTDWADGLEVRQLAIKEEEKTGAVGLVVTALRKCPKAKGRTLLLNSPYMAEPPEDYNGPMDGYLPSAVVELIEEAETQATAYLNGERGEQTTLELDSENAKSFDERAAAAEVASTRKPRKTKDHEPGVGEIHNPDATEAPTDETLRQLLLTVERDVPIDALQRWTSSEREAAQRWAEARQQQIVGQRKGRMPKEPECIQRDATLPLKADSWEATAVRVDDAGAQEIRDAATVEG